MSLVQFSGTETTRKMSCSTSSETAYVGSAEEFVKDACYAPEVKKFELQVKRAGRAMVGQIQTPVSQKSRCLMQPTALLESRKDVRDKRVTQSPLLESGQRGETILEESSDEIRERHLQCCKEDLKKKMFGVSEGKSDNECNYQMQIMYVFYQGHGPNVSLLYEVR